MNRSKAIGTAVESAVVKHVKSKGFAYAERITLHGSEDHGDIRLDPRTDVIIECKGGKAAESASDSQVAAWLTEVERERRHAGAAYAFLVMKRAGKGAQQVGAWWAVIGANHLFCLMHGTSDPWDGADEGAVLRMPLDHMLGMIPDRYGRRA